MNDVIYNRLIQAARERRFIQYNDLTAAISLDIGDAAGMNALTEILEEIANHEFANGRPLLAAIIVSKSNNMPGNGLFDYAKRKGLMNPKDKDKLAFFLSEAKKVHDYWASAPRD
jgi:hypothetical protein